ncbi:2OG-Fe(II) oxygenase [Pseudooceanicola sediminis]|uniref:2OG-Fe(II) oxygenase n=1 Tax=Pseudooceanicola sediminis TaxID=2211117 RepID=A0A399IW96_9RHOB|nr:2OG-Fe(II) oxygenase [Pseudooceanicola sediminis]RII37415.1 2OG-Fe(II) oxygenase [Pseudooceanicola sediminis]|tara:strand:+ start:23151 stop:23702 length:552 start_codon:yes stop_codon:yes gene_type:complete
MIAFHVVPQAFSLAECAQIAALALAAPAQEAGLVRRARDHNLRRAELVWVDDVPDTDWVMDRLIDVVRVANREVFDFDLQDFAESPQIARYDAARQGHFGWHSDVGDGTLAARRKLTLVTQLSDPGDYSGGTLEVWFDSNLRTAPLEPGTAVLFPSFALHRVVPVTQGERLSLTVWAHGAPFR